MKTARGMTLVEVVAATVLLALLAAAVVPLLHDAAAATSDQAPAVTIDALAALADQSLADPRLHGLPDWPPAGEASLVMPGQRETGLAVLVHVMPLGPESTMDGAPGRLFRVVFECAGMTVTRWVRVTQQVIPRGAR